MVYPREVLNEIKWRHQALSEASITYVHRGAPGDVLTISGEDIKELGRSFFETAEATIPYHRILAIRFRVICCSEKNEDVRGLFRALNGARCS